MIRLARPIRSMTPMKNMMDVSFSILTDSLTNPGMADRERLGSDDAENAPNRRKSENDGCFMLSPVDREVSRAEYF